MNMPDQIKRTIALFALTAWVLLYGASFSEEVESLQDTIESPDQDVELALSLDMDQNTDESPIVPKSIRLANVAVVDDLQTLIIPLDSADGQHHVPSRGHKLFKFLSTYRL